MGDRFPAIRSARGIEAADRRKAANYRAVASADASQREALRFSRDAPLRERDRCTSQVCVSASYQKRISEIGVIMTR